MKKGKTILVAGKFDPGAHNGHIEHIIKASKLGDYLFIATHTDEIVASHSDKGFCAVPLWARRLTLEGLLLRLGIKGQVIVAEPLDIDGTIANTIKVLKPDVLAKGGDRTPDNMPQSELDACKSVGCQIIYQIGSKINSNSDIVRRENENRRDQTA